MIKYIYKLDHKICSSCKIDLFKQYKGSAGLVCGRCGQQYQIRTEKENK